MRGFDVHFEVRCIIDKVFTQSPRVMQNPAIAVRDNEGIPIRQVDLIRRHSHTDALLFSVEWKCGSAWQESPGRSVRAAEANGR